MQRWYLRQGTAFSSLKARIRMEVKQKHQCPSDTCSAPRPESPAALFVCEIRSSRPIYCSKISGAFHVLTEDSKLETWTKHHEMNWLAILAMYYKIFQHMFFQKHRILHSQQTERWVAASSSINMCQMELPLRTQENTEIRNPM